MRLIKNNFALIGIIFSILLTTTAFAKTEQLTPPRISPENVKENVTCIRPSREGLFRIAVEKRNDKLVVHDYGHGGAGWTLLFGSVDRAIRLFEAELARNPDLKGEAIRVVGGGAHGLLTAIRLKETGYEVKIIARDFEELASHKGAGTFAPGPMHLTSDQRKELGQVLVDSYKVWAEIALKTHPEYRDGAEFIPLYTMDGTQLGLDALIDQGFLAAPEKVTVDFGNGKSHQVVKYQSIYFDTRKMLIQFHKKIAELGIPAETGSIENFDQVQERIIFDCTGVGGGPLNQDRNVVPVQGHLVTLKDQPNLNQLKYMFYFQVDHSKELFDEFGNPMENFIYYTPKGGGTLGGTYIKGEWRLNTNKAQHEEILKRAMAFFGESFGQPNSEPISNRTEEL